MESHTPRSYVCLSYFIVLLTYITLKILWPKKKQIIDIGCLPHIGYLLYASYVLLDSVHWCPWHNCYLQGTADQPAAEIHRPGTEPSEKGKVYMQFFHKTFQSVPSSRVQRGAAAVIEMLGVNQTLETLALKFNFIPDPWAIKWVTVWSNTICATHAKTVDWYSQNWAYGSHWVRWVFKMTYL